ncbi:TPA: hypothetical protein ACMDRZ_003200 [Vibrio cholerae]|uniref:hypothetical protein n=1 Tax=Vibrio cholerae TaxID=666 RepID=UPI001C2FCF28|nr:hypothetical protein [Vibrio cholerae]
MDDYRPSELYKNLTNDQGQGVNVFENYHFQVDAFKSFENKLVLLGNGQLSSALDYFYVLRRTQRANGEDKHVDQEVVFDYIQILLSERAQECHWLAEGRARIKHCYKLFPGLNSTQLEYCFSRSGVPI